VTATTLVVTSSWPRTGDPMAGTFVRTDALARVRAGERVVVAAPEGAGAARGGEGLRVVDVGHAGLFGSPGGVSRLRENPLRIAGMSAFAADVRRLVRAERPRKIVAHWILPGGALARFAAGPASGVEIEIVAHGGDVRLLEAMPRSIARRVLEAIAGDATLRAVSANLAERITRIAPALARALVVAPMPLATDDARLRGDVRRAAFTLRGEWGRRWRGGGGPLHVVASRLVPGKPVERAIDHVALRRAGLVVVGDGPLRARIVERAARACVPLEAIGARPHEEALAWIAAADVVLAPVARGEGNPTVVREARALGTPVVVLTP
jgi:hypothetical protein